MELIPPVYNRDHLPISLQETCYLCLIGHLDQYPIDLLSLLPTMLRHQLLSRLPVTDLLALENTPVTNEFEMTPYWKALYNRNHSDTPSLEPFDKSSSSDFKEMLLAKILNLVTKPLRYQSRIVSPFQGCTCFQTHPNPLVQLLCLPYWFSKPDVAEFLDEFDPTTLYTESVCTASDFQYICSYHNDVIPNRFKSLYIGDPWKKWDDHIQTAIKIILSKVDINSLHLSIDYEYHDMSSLFHKDNELVTQLVSHVESIKLNCSSDCCIQQVHKGSFTPGLFPRISEHDPTDILKTLLTVTNPTLKKIIVCDSSRINKKNTQFIVRQQLQSMARIFAPGFASIFSGFTTYRGLVELNISGLSDEIDSDDAKRHPSNHAYPLFQLAAIIINQKHLKKVNLQGFFKPTPGCDRLMTVLADFICKPTFETLSVAGKGMAVQPFNENAEINCDLVVKLFFKFLTTPAVRKQRLHFSDIVFIGNCGKHQTLLSKLRYLPDESQKWKNLYLSNVELGLEMIPVLSKIPPICINSFKIHQICSHNSLEIFSNLSNIMTRELSLSFFQPLNGSKEIGELIAPLLLNHNIQKFLFSADHECCLSIQSHLNSVIAKHAKSFKTLEFITVQYYEENDLGIFDSLIDLAQVVPLKLTLNLLPNHLDLLLKLFQEKGPAQKIHKLELNGDLEDDDECIPLLKDISENLVYTDLTA